MQRLSRQASEALEPEPSLSGPLSVADTIEDDSKIAIMHRSMSFMQLPQELRMLIYKALFDDTHVYIATSRMRRGLHPSSWAEQFPPYPRDHTLALLRTCKAVRAEATPVFYSRTLFLSPCGFFSNSYTDFDAVDGTWWACGSQHFTCDIYGAHDIFFSIEHDWNFVLWARTKVFTILIVVDAKNLYLRRRRTWRDDAGDGDYGVYGVYTHSFAVGGDDSYLNHLDHYVDGHWLTTTLATLVQPSRPFRKGHCELFFRFRFLGESGEKMDEFVLDQDFNLKEGPTLEHELCREVIGRLTEQQEAMKEG